MKQVGRLKDSTIYIEVADILRIANQAVRKAKEENKKFGIPDTFWKNGKVYYVLTNGEITTVPPAIMRR